MARAMMLSVAVVLVALALVAAEAEEKRSVYYPRIGRSAAHLLDSGDSSSDEVDREIRATNFLR